MWTTPVPLGLRGNSENLIEKRNDGLPGASADVILHRYVDPATRVSFISVIDPKPILPVPHDVSKIRDSLLGYCTILFIGTSLFSEMFPLQMRPTS